MGGGGEKCASGQIYIVQIVYLEIAYSYITMREPEYTLPSAISCLSAVCTQTF